MAADCETAHGLYIVIEGQDGTGKTTQVNRLAEHFRALGREVVVINEGAETDSGLASTDAINKIIHAKKFALTPETNVALFTAQRLELWRKIIAPALAKNRVVLASRSWWTTLAYQCFGEGVPRQIVEDLTRELLPPRYITPDAAVILTIDDATRIARTRQRSAAVAEDTFDARTNDFFARANAGYTTIARELHLPIIDASGTIEEATQKIMEYI